MYCNLIVNPDIYRDFKYIYIYMHTQKYSGDAHGSGILDEVAIDEGFWREDDSLDVGVQHIAHIRTYR